MSEDGSSLRALQQRFHALVTAPEGVARGLVELGLAPADLESLIVSDARLSSVARLDIYADMYFFRIRDVLREDYAKVLAVVGEAAFHNLCVDYLLACPPAHASIAAAGARLPAFLGEHALAHERPWLAELALLERRRTDVFDAPDCAVLTVEDLQRLDPASFATLPLRLVAAHAVVEAQHAVDELWQRLHERADSDEAEDAPAARRTTLLVWREDPMAIYHRALGDDERALLPSLVTGTDFGVVCSELARLHATSAAASESSSAAEAATAQRAFELLATWARDGLLVRA